MRWLRVFFSGQCFFRRQLFPRIIHKCMKIAGIDRNMFEHVRIHLVLLYLGRGYSQISVHNFPSTSKKNQEKKQENGIGTLHLNCILKRMFCFWKSLHYFPGGNMCLHTFLHICAYFRFFRLAHMCAYFSAYFTHILRICWPLPAQLPPCLSYPSQLYPPCRFPLPKFADMAPAIRPGEGEVLKTA